LYREGHIRATARECPVAGRVYAPARGPAYKIYRYTGAAKMNESLAHHALLVLVMVALMLAGGLIEAGRAPASGAMASTNSAGPVAVSVAVTSCDQRH